jgi:hypothetical protein
MSQSQEVSDQSPLDRLKTATENFEEIRRRIGPYMPVPKPRVTDSRSDWRTSEDLYRETALKVK